MARVTITTKTIEGTAEEVAQLWKVHAAEEATQAEKTAARKNEIVPQPLTEREFDVGRRILAGMKRKEIARELQINEDTVKTHIANLYTKLGIHRKAELRAHRKLFEGP